MITIINPNLPGREKDVADEAVPHWERCGWIVKVDVPQPSDQTGVDGDSTGDANADGAAVGGEHDGNAEGNADTTSTE